MNSQALPELPGLQLLADGGWLMSIRRCDKMAAVRNGSALN